jgi:hypothetical protein
MRTQLVISTAAALLLVGSGAGLAQKQTPRQPDNSGAPTGSYRETHPQSMTPDRPPAATMPRANAPSPETTGQTPSTSEKMHPAMDSVGAPKMTPSEDGK